jgi:ATP-dependent RNA helicase RhlE
MGPNPIPPVQITGRQLRSASLQLAEEILLKTFAELDLPEPIQRALAEENYQIPTPIQAQTIPAAIEGRDVLGCAQTGTGKTAAFALPILDYLYHQNRKARKHHPNALILAPTRELAIQIGDSFKTYGRYAQLKQTLVYGGVGQGNQVKAMEHGVHILIATPGRLLDLMNQGVIKLSQLEIFVLDEADRMMDMGFLPDLKRIISQLPEKRQSLFFSATIAPNIVELSKKLLYKPISVNVTPKSRSVDRIEQRVLFVEKSKKQKTLEYLLDDHDVGRAIVFTRTKRMANTVSTRLGKAGIKAAAIHGNKSQNARQRALDAFRKNHLKVLVATDVAARGIDIDGVTHVFNYDLPNEPESYVHRIGRTGRAGAEGMAISFCTADDRGDLKAIEKLIEQKVPVDPDYPMPAYSESAPSRNPSKGSRRRRPPQRSGPRAAKQGGSTSGGSRSGDRSRSGSSKNANANGTNSGRSRRRRGGGSGGKSGGGRAQGNSGRR